MWLLQSASGGFDGFDPSTIILALAGVVSTLGALLLRGWQERVKRSETEERQAATDLMAARAAELDRVLQDRDAWRARAQYLEDQRAALTKRLLEVRAERRREMSDPPPTTQPRTQSPSPGRYSTQTSRRTPRSED